MIVAATGHRPNKLGGYDDAINQRLVRGAAWWMREHGATKAISGMALGWDMAVARAAINAGVPLIAALPFRGQERRWPKPSRDLYNWLLENSYSVHVVCDGGYAAWKMQRRNEWMVDNADRILALWDGSDGGTANCIKYAQERGRPITNLWASWRKKLHATTQ